MKLTRIHNTGRKSTKYFQKNSTAAGIDPPPPHPQKEHDSDGSTFDEKLIYKHQPATDVPSPLSLVPCWSIK